MSEENEIKKDEKKIKSLKPKDTPFLGTEHDSILGNKIVNVRPQTDAAPLESLVKTISPLVELGEKYFRDAEHERQYRIQELATNARYDEKELARVAKQDEREHELSLKELELRGQIFNRLSWIGSGVIFLIFGTAIALFALGNIESGLKVLAYVAVGATLVTSGFSFEKARQETKRRKEIEVTYRKAIEDQDDE